MGGPASRLVRDLVLGPLVDIGLEGPDFVVGIVGEVEPIIRVVLAPDFLSRGTE